MAQTDKPGLAAATSAGGPLCARWPHFLPPAAPGVPRCPPADPKLPRGARLGHGPLPLFLSHRPCPPPARLHPKHSFAFSRTAGRGASAAVSGVFFLVFGLLCFGLFLSGRASVSWNSESPSGCLFTQSNPLLRPLRRSPVAPAPLSGPPLLEGRAVGPAWPPCQQATPQRATGSPEVMAANLVWGVANNLLAPSSD